MTDNKLMHVVVLDRIGGTKAPDVVAAFDEKDDAQTFIDAQKDNGNFTLLSVPLNPPVTPAALPWYAYFDIDSHKLRELSRNGNLGHDWVRERLGLVRSSYSGLNLEIWFLATGREDAEQTAQNMFRSVMQREAVGGFKYLRHPIFSPSGDMKVPFEHPYYDFESGRIIYPAQGEFILPKEEILTPDGKVDTTKFRLVTGRWLYDYRRRERPLNHVDKFIIYN